MKKLLIFLWTIFIVCVLCLLGAEFLVNKNCSSVGGSVLKQYKIVVNPGTLNSAKDETTKNSEAPSGEGVSESKSVEGDKKEKTL